MKVLVDLNGDLVEFEINEVGVLGIATYFAEGEKYGIPIKPSPTDVARWLDEGKILDIRFRDEKEMARLIKNLLKR